MSAKQWLLFAVACTGAWGCGATADEPVTRVDDALHVDAPVGLSLFFQNGVMPAFTSLGNPARFLQEIDITESVPSATDNGISDLIASPAVREVDWRG
ncbi:MAG TPA: hypothetical protein VGM44_20260, partial [Polyangiaceae bacterium]